MIGLHRLGAAICRFQCLAMDDGLHLTRSDNDVLYSCHASDSALKGGARYRGDRISDWTNAGYLRYSAILGRRSFTAALRGVESGGHLHHLGNDGPQPFRRLGVDNLAVATKLCAVASQPPRTGDSE